MLADEGLKICVNTLRKVTAGMGEMLARLTKLGSVKVSGDAAGRRIVVTTDGGRVRLREKRRGKTEKGHKRFKPAWREPRLFIIYATDDKGRIDTTFSPIIDGSLGSCDRLLARGGVSRQTHRQFLIERQAENSVAEDSEEPPVSRRHQPCDHRDRATDRGRTVRGSDVSVRGTHLVGPGSVASTVRGTEVSCCDFFAAFLAIVAFAVGHRQPRPRLPINPLTPYLLTLAHTSPRQKKSRVRNYTGPKTTDPGKNGFPGRLLCVEPVRVQG